MSLSVLNLLLHLFLPTVNAIVRRNTLIQQHNTDGLNTLLLTVA